MKLYDTINGTFISDTEWTIDDIRDDILSGEYTEHELKNWTLEGEEPEDSIALCDIKGYFYESGSSGSIIACSDGRHADTVWGDGVDEQGHLAVRHSLTRGTRNKAVRKLHEELMAESEGRLLGDSHAMEFAYSCVKFDITDVHAEDADGMLEAIKEYVSYFL